MRAARNVRSDPRSRCSTWGTRRAGRTFPELRPAILQPLPAQLGRASGREEWPTKASWQKPSELCPACHSP